MDRIRNPGFMYCQTICLLQKFHAEYKQHRGCLFKVLQTAALPQSEQVLRLLDLTCRHFRRRRCPGLRLNWNHLQLPGTRHYPLDLFKPCFSSKWSNNLGYLTYNTSSTTFDLWKHVHFCSKTPEPNSSVDSHMKSYENMRFSTSYDVTYTICTYTLILTTSFHMTDSFLMTSTTKGNREGAS